MQRIEEEWVKTTSGSGMVENPPLIKVAVGLSRLTQMGKSVIQSICLLISRGDPVKLRLNACMLNECFSMLGPA